MDLTLRVNSSDPSKEVMIVTELINSQKQYNVTVIWQKELKEQGKAGLYDNKSNKILATSSNDIIRCLARTLDPNLYGGCEAQERTEVDHWISFSIGQLSLNILDSSSLEYLDHTLQTRTWLVAKKITLADICVFCALLNRDFIKMYSEKYRNITRWFHQTSTQESVRTGLSQVESNSTAPIKPANAVRKQEGKFIDLPGAEMGKVVVRFPPEASGYLHIGHAKAALLNQYYADAFQGQLIMRFDDTNPAKETVEFEDAILEDLKLLQIKPDRFTHTSDYFDVIEKYCTDLIKSGHAYVDDTPAQLMKEQREQKVKSDNRDNPIEKNLALWDEMRGGTAKGQECCVRAKIDHESVNGCMRDPTIYRCKSEAHPRTGDKYKIYPTYDFACPIVDSIENVTHTLRTMEYRDRDPQFFWILEALGLRKPHIWEYSRLNMTHTVLSKRKLTWFVSEGLVDGWDDPRFPTVRGILRRGMTVEGLKQFIIAQGSSKSVVFMEWDKIWAFNKKVIDPVAVRYTALDSNKTVPVEVVDAKEEWLTVQNHPKDPSRGSKQVRAGPKILIEKEDAESLVEGRNTTFINWGNLMIKKIERKNGAVVSVKASLNLDDKNYKDTLKVTWLAAPSAGQKTKEADAVSCYAVYFDHILSVPVLGKDDDLKDFVAKDTRREVEMLGEAELRRVKKGEIVELRRKGFFICDVPYAPVSSYSSREQPVVMFHIPDGRMAAPPSKTPAANAKVSSTSVANASVLSEKQLMSACAVNEKIVAQGDKVRRLKAEKANKATVEAEVKVLLDLKAQYKSSTGEDWKPGVVPKAPKAENNETAGLSKEATKQKSKIAELQKHMEKLQKQMDEELKKLQELEGKHNGKVDEGDRTQKRANDKTKGGKEKPARLAVANANIDNKQAAERLSEEIQKQGEKVRSLKSSKAEKNAIDQEVKVLLSLKNDYKNMTGQDWKPVTSSDANTGNKQAAEKLSEEIQKQGEKVRSLKSSKAEKNAIDQEVKVLLSLKNDYKNMTGQDWKPMTSSDANAGNKQAAEKLSQEIQKQGDKVRNLKSSKAEKNAIDQEVKVLLSLKNDYKNMTGQDWKPMTSSDANTGNKQAAERLSQEIQKQGDKVRNLKGSKAEKNAIDQEVKVLLSLKNDYKSATGQDWKPVTSSNATPKKKKEEQAKPGKTAEKEATKGSSAAAAEDANKTGTRLGLEVKKLDNFADWYSQVITKSDMIEYHDVSGCYAILPWSFTIWEIMMEYMNREFKTLGVKNCYFPMFVTRAVLEKEKSHIADFAPEVAWVTKCGESDLAEPVAIRPTSETVMYPSYAKRLRSDNQLPLKLNQWCSVVRWEFKDPKPFLRTREFLWQEGHTAFASKEEADKEVLTILDLYGKVYEELLAVPVVKGRKTEKEKFAGGDYTTTVEAFISASGRAIQGATSHHLGQNFSKMFNIQVECAAKGAEKGSNKMFVYQNSWGLTTRTIGVMIMVHGDDKGLVLPPMVATIQAVIIPCGITASTKAEQEEQLLSECKKLLDELSKGNVFRVEGDFRNRTPGWKFSDWELKGVPVRIELGPAEIRKNQVTFVCRDNLERRTTSRDQVIPALDSLLKDIQLRLLSKARKDLDAHIKQAETWTDFCHHLNNNNLLLSPFCGEPACEDNIKADSAREESDEEIGTLSMGAKSLCIPFQQPKLTKPLNEMRCIHDSCKNKPKFYTLFGRSY